jgi:hypothetical protein
MYLLIFVSVLDNKEIFKTDKVGSAIDKLCEKKDLRHTIDVEQYDKNPFQISSFGKVFYDVDVFENEGEEEYGGTFWCFPSDGIEVI